MNLDWILDNRSRILDLTVQHAWLALPPVVLSFLIAVPFGWWAHRNRHARRLVLPLSGILYALPSLPLFIVLPVLLGTRILDPVNVVVALTLYGVALMARTATDAFDAVGATTRDDALALGHSPVQVFSRVALPLAGPSLLAGLRVVSASTLSLVSVGALIGVPSLGYFFTDGYRRAFGTQIAVGILGTVALAALFDLVLVTIGRLLLPWVRATDRRRS